MSIIFWNSDSDLIMVKSESEFQKKRVIFLSKIMFLDFFSFEYIFVQNFPQFNIFTSTTESTAIFHSWTFYLNLMIFISIVHSINFFHIQRNIYIDSAIVLCCIFWKYYFLPYFLFRIKYLGWSQWKQTWNHSNGNNEIQRFFNIVFCIE